MSMPGQSSSVKVNITDRTILRIILWAVAAVLAYHFVGKIAHALTLVFASFFLAMALNPVVGWMTRRLKIASRARATAAAYLVVLAILVGFFALVTPPLVRQTRDFIQNVPQIVETFQKQDNGLAKTVKRYNLDQKLVQSAKDFASNYSNFGASIFDTGKRAVDILASVAVVIVMTFMMLVEGPYWLDLFFGILPPNRRQHYRRIAHEMYRGVSGFVNGQVILAVIAGFFAFTVLEILSNIMNVSVNAVALAGIVAVFGLIPLLGNLLGSSIVILVCLSNSGSLALAMLIYFIIYFFLESHTLQPVIQSRLNDLTPLLVFVAAIIGVGFAGLLGAIVAIPTATAIKILVEDYFQERNKRRPPTEKQSLAN